MQRLLWQHEINTQNVVPPEPQPGSSRMLNVTDVSLPRSQATAGIGSNVRKQNSEKQK